MQSSKKYDELKIKFNELQNLYKREDDQRFGNTMEAANNDDKDNLFQKIDLNNNLSMEQYFEIACDMTQRPVTTENSSLTQDGSSLVITYSDDVYGAVSIRYENLADGRSVIATLIQHHRVVNVRVYPGNEVLQQNTSCELYGGDNKID